MPHLMTFDIDELDDMPAGGCEWKAAAGILASCLSLALQIHKTPSQEQMPPHGVGPEPQ